MEQMTRIIRHGYTLPAALYLGIALSVVPPAVAQPAGGDEPPAQSGESVDAAARENTANGSDADQDTGNGEGVVLSPFDYEASESISEDASVSFPVDI